MWDWRFLVGDASRTIDVTVENMPDLALLASCLEAPRRPEAPLPDVRLSEMRSGREEFVDYLVRYANARLQQLRRCYPQAPALNPALIAPLRVSAVLTPRGAFAAVHEGVRASVSRWRSELRPETEDPVGFRLDLLPR